MLDMLRGMAAHDDSDQVRRMPVSRAIWPVTPRQGGVNSPTSVGSFKIEDALAGRRANAVVMPLAAAQSWLSPSAADAARDDVVDTSASASAKRVMQRKSHIQDAALHRYVMEEAASANAQCDAQSEEQRAPGSGGDDGNAGDMHADGALDVNMHT